MKNLINKFIFTLSLGIISCSSNEDSVLTPTQPVNSPPIATSYVIPNNNQTCIGTIQTNSIDVDFEWSNFTDEETSTLTYDLSITELSQNLEIYNQSNGNNITQTVSLERGKSYSWKVTATDNENQTTTGPTWQFQTPFEAVSNYSPFPSTLLTPTLYDILPVGGITLTWQGNDPDTDETSQLVYDLYLGDGNLMQNLGANLTTTSFDTNLTNGVYYWYIKATDPSGNSSNSQTWQFVIQ